MAGQRKMAKVSRFGQCCGDLRVTWQVLLRLLDYCFLEDGMKSRVQNTVACTFRGWISFMACCMELTTLSLSLYIPGNLYIPGRDFLYHDSFYLCSKACLNS